MILTLNLDKYRDYMIAIFKNEFNFFHNLIEILEPLKRNRIFLEIIDNIFRDEYKKCFFYTNPDIELEELLTQEQISFFQKYCLNQVRYSKEVYVQFFSKLLKFDLSYENFFSNNKVESEEKQAYKLSIAQSLIRMIFSRDKEKYIKDRFYEYNLIKKIIDKDIEETREKYGDQYKTLFRKEDICDDFLKYMFFVFGNKIMIESFVNPVKKLLTEIWPKDRDINKDEFNNLITDFISKLKENIPNVLKLLLKILYESIRSHFTIEIDNYGPLYTTLFFNFINSPRVQSLYDINSLNSNLIRSLNRLLRNACFNFKFSDQDPLNEFNDIIEKNHLKIKNFIKKNIIEININDGKVKSSLGDIFNEKYLIYPNFLFHLDKTILLDCMKGELNDNNKDKGHIIEKVLK